MKSSLLILTTLVYMSMIWTCLPSVEARSYNDIFKGKETQTCKGFITVHKVDENIYLEIPMNMLGKKMLTGSIVESSSDQLESPVGYMPSEPASFIFEMEDSSVLMKSIMSGVPEGADDNILKALSISHAPAVLERFRIDAITPDSSAVIFDASSLFLGGDRFYDPIDQKAYNSMSGYVKRSGTYIPSNSFIESISAFGDNVSVTSSVTFRVKAALLGVFEAEQETYLTAGIRRSIMLLPDEEMEQRPADPRIGAGFTSSILYPGGTAGTDRVMKVTKWDIDKNPVTFYIDDSFPETWIPYIKESFRKWNDLFAELGYENAICAKCFSEAGEEFNPSDMKYSCVRYIPSPSDKILDNKWYDPASGEILHANIYVNQGVVETIQKNMFLQTSHADSTRRKMILEEDKAGQAIGAMLLRNIGHCLGLADNMAGSWAYPADSLKSAAFTNEYGISSSVMDELPYNFIAGPEDYATGTAMMQDSPGIYDKYVIGYMYGKIPDGMTYDEKKSYLKDIVDKHIGDPRFFYGKVQSTKAFYDPRSMQADLGNNAVEAVKYGFWGLAEMVANASSWLDSEDSDYSYRQQLYDGIVNQTYEYVKQVFVNVGGIYINERYAGDPVPSYLSVPKERQRDFLIWIMEQISDLSWLENKDLSADVGLLGSIADFCQKYYSQFIFTQIGELWLSESKSEDPYTQIEAMSDVSDFVWRDSGSGQKLSDITKFQQNLFIDYLLLWSSPQPDKSSGEGSPIRFRNSPERAHLWFGMLSDTRAIVAKAVRRAKDEDTENHYRYLLWKIDGKMSK